MTTAAMRSEPAPLRVLIVEDSQEDAELIVLELKRGGYDPDYLRVDEAGAMRQALEQREWDLVLSDYSMPRFSLGDALREMEDKGVDLPFVIVSATIGHAAFASSI